MSKQLEAIFRPQYRKLTDAEADQVTRIKDKALALAVEFRPTDSREKSLAMTKLEESVMWAVKGVTG